MKPPVESQPLPFLLQHLELKSNTSHVIVVPYRIGTRGRVAIQDALAAYFDHPPQLIIIDPAGANVITPLERGDGPESSDEGSDPH